MLSSSVSSSPLSSSSLSGLAAAGLVAGIGIGQRFLGLAFAPVGRGGRFPNTAEGIARLVRRLIEAGAGRIVNIASTEAIVTTAGLAGYAATKAGVVGLTKSFAVELGRTGITVNCICPGPIDTGMTAGIETEAKATYARRRVPLRRYGSPEEVAQMTLNLCLPSASFVNGATIPVDGGMTIRHT